MIKIFLINIVFVILHLNTVADGEKLNGVVINVRGVISKYNVLNFNITGDFCKNNKVDLSNNKSHSSGLTKKTFATKYPGLMNEKIRILKNRNKNKFRFFESGVSPPVGMQR